MKILLAGSRRLGALVLTDLQAAGHEILLVSSPRESHPGRLDELHVATLAARLRWQHAGNLLALPSPTDRQALDGLELIVCAHAHEFIGAPVRHLAEHGALGYHPSLLPRWRGRYAVEHTVIADTVTGGSVYWLSDDLDAGPLQAQSRHVPVLPGDTARTLWRRELQPLGQAMLAQAVADVSVGALRRMPQRGPITFATARDPSPDLDPEGSPTAEAGW